VSSSTSLGLNAAEHSDDPFNLWVSHSLVATFVHLPYIRFPNSQNVIQISLVFGGHWAGVRAGTIYGRSQPFIKELY
jgi:hypothetical protein